MDDHDVDVYLRRERRRRRILTVVFVLMAAGGIAAVAVASWRVEHPSAPPKIELTAEQRGQIRAEIARSRSLLEEADRPWHSAIAAVDPAAVAAAEGPGGGACNPIEYARRMLAENTQSSSFGTWELLDRPLQASGGSGGSMMSLGRTPFPLAFIEAGEPPPAHSPEATIRLAQLERQLALIDTASHRTFEERLRVARIDALHAPSVLVELTEVRQPDETGGGGFAYREFAPGAVRARAWVYEPARGAVVCAGIVSAASSTSVDTGVTNLDEDLLVNLLRALPDGVRRVP
jgi:hypothetical protein